MGNPINLADVSEFTGVINNACLSDCGFTGNKFTWLYKRLGRATISQRLDRALANTKWIYSYTTGVLHLNKLCSDHSSLLIDMNMVEQKGSSFRFLNAWTHHHHQFF